MILIVDQTDSEPPYGQIRAQISAQVEAGELAAGDRLPTVRRLAGDLGLAPNTVARAYRELEQDGILETRGRGGTFISGDPASRRAKIAATSYLQQAHDLGLTADEASALLRHVANLNPQPEAQAR